MKSKLENGNNSMEVDKNREIVHVSSSLINKIIPNSIWINPEGIDINSIYLKDAQIRVINYEPNDECILLKRLYLHHGLAYGNINAETNRVKLSNESNEVYGTVGEGKRTHDKYININEMIKKGSKITIIDPEASYTNEETILFKDKEGFVVTGLVGLSIENPMQKLATLRFLKRLGFSDNELMGLNINKVFYPFRESSSNNLNKECLTVDNFCRQSIIRALSNQETKCSLIPISALNCEQFSEFLRAARRQGKMAYVTTFSKVAYFIST